MYDVLSISVSFHSTRDSVSRLERYPGHSSTTTSTRMRASVDRGNAASHEHLRSEIQRLSLSSDVYHIRFPSHRISERRCWLERQKHLFLL